MGASSVRDVNAAEELYRANDPSEDDDEPTTMAPLASQVIAAMMNDDQLEARPIPARPSGFVVRSDPNAVTLPEELGRPSEVVERAIADALRSLERQRTPNITPDITPNITPNITPDITLDIPPTIRAKTIWDLPVSSTEIAIFATSFVLTVVPLLAFLFR